MTRALLLKELREHGWVLLGALLFLAVGYGVIAHDQKDAGSSFVALTRFTLLFGIVQALIVNNRFVVREFAGRTQLFLEVLPVTRARVITVKLLLGAAFMFLPILLAFAAGAIRASGREPMNAKYLAFVLGRALLFALAVHAYAFFAALLGRYRYIWWGGGFLGLATAASRFGISMDHLPFFRLVGDQMAFERHVFPLFDGLLALAISAVLIGAGYFLALSWEGGMTAQLARRMSHREKIFFVSAAIAWIGVMAAIDRHKKRPAFDLAEATHTTEGATLVGIALREGEPREPVEKLGTQVANDLEALRTWLALEQMPPLFVVPDSTLDPDVFLRAHLPSADGVVVKGALAHPDLDVPAFRTYVVAEVLDWYSLGRASREPVAVLLEGFAGWWVARTPDARMRLRAAAAITQGPITAADLRDWGTTRERLGECVSGALAIRTVQVLAEQLGPDAFQKLARQAFGNARPPDDVRALLRPRSVHALLGAAQLDALVTALNASFAAESAGLDGLQRFTLDAGLTPIEAGAAFELHVHVEAPDGGAPAFTILHSELGPYTGRLAQVHHGLYAAIGDGVAPWVLSPGERIFWAVDIPEPALGCPVRLAARREEAR